MTSAESFLFFTERRLTALTGRRARTAGQLLEHLETVSGSCVFHHTHPIHLAPPFEKPRSYNEFANWASYALQEEALAERLAAIDLLAITSIRGIREALIGVISRHVETAARAARECPPGSEFHFCEAKSFIMPTGVAAQTNAELFEGIAGATNACLHFHFFEARLRLERPTNDFSQWLRDRGEMRMAQRIERLNPYAIELDELKREILKVGKKYRTK